VTCANTAVNVHIVPGPADWEMQVTVPRTPSTIGPLGPAVVTFALSLRAEGKKPKTIRTYTEAAIWLAQRTEPEPQSWAQVTRKHVRQHMAWLAENKSPAYASNQYRALQAWFRWLADEEEIPNPMAGMTPPAVPQKLIPVLADDELPRLLATCSSKQFSDIRDRAIILLFASSGARLAEVAACVSATWTWKAPPRSSPGKAARCGSSGTRLTPPWHCPGT